MPQGSPAASARTGPNRVHNRADLQRVLSLVTAQSGQRQVSHAVNRPVDTAAHLPDAAVGSHLPLHPHLQALLGVRGSVSLLYALLANPMRHGAYAAIVGRTDLGLLAASEHPGIDLARLAVLPRPGADWPAVVAALLDGIDLVAVDVPGDIPTGVARSLAARARRQGSVLLPLTPAWPGCDIVLTAQSQNWHGLSQGRGLLNRHEMLVEASGRGAAARHREAVLTLPLPPAAHPADIQANDPPGSLVDDLRQQTA
jgi:hypothetical protein